MTDLQVIKKRFGASLRGWKQRGRIKRKLEKCNVCGAFHLVGLPCSNCGVNGKPSTSLQRLVESMRRNKESQQEPTAILHCFRCGHSQRTSRQIAERMVDGQKCPSCGHSFLLDALSEEEWAELRPNEPLEENTMTRFALSLRNSTGRAIGGSTWER